MDSLLILAGIFALGAVMVGLHILLEGRRRCASQGKQFLSVAATDSRQERRARERRVADNVVFPCKVSGVLIEHNRRTHPDRRLAV